MAPECPLGAWIYVDGVPVSRAPFSVKETGGDCIITMDARGLSLLRAEPGANYTLVLEFQDSNASVTVLVPLEAAQSPGPRGNETEVIQGEPGLVTGAPGGEGYRGRAGGASLGLVLAAVLAAASLLVGWREYGGGRRG